MSIHIQTYSIRHQSWWKYVSRRN